MNPPYQIPASVGVPAQLNSDLSDIQRGATVIGPVEAFGQAITAVLSANGGDIYAGKALPGSQLQCNAATQVQRKIYDAKCLGGVVPPGLSIDELLTDNPGPTGDGEWWNWSYAAFGLDPGLPADPGLKTGSVIVVDQAAGTAKTVEGLVP